MSGQGAAVMSAVSAALLQSREKRVRKGASVRNNPELDFRSVGSVKVGSSRHDKIESFRHLQKDPGLIGSMFRIVDLDPLKTVAREAFHDFFEPRGIAFHKRVGMGKDRQSIGPSDELYRLDRIEFRLLHVSARTAFQIPIKGFLHRGDVPLPRHEPRNVGPPRHAATGFTVHFLEG